jgi:exopolysaccharide biosynthesis operon protein EpsL
MVGFSGNFTVRSLTFLPGALASILLSLPIVATADPEDTLNFAVGTGIQYEDNLFRLEDSADTDTLPGRPHRSDLLYSANAGIKIDKPYAQQRFKLDLMANENKFQNNSFLDYTGFDYSAAWIWHLTPNISGTLLTKQEQTLVNFADYRDFTQKNVQTSQVNLFSIDGLIGGGWHLLGGAMKVRARNSQTFTAVGDYVQDSVEFGGKYVSPAENWISLVQRESNGEYGGRPFDPVAQLDSGFDESETEAKLSWRLTGKSLIRGKLGYLDRKHDNFSQRDYDGVIGKLEYEWNPTGKLQLNTSIARNLYNFQEAFNSYYVANTLSIGPEWDVTAKTKIKLRYDYSERDYHGAIVPTPELRHDTVQSFLLGAEWQATRTILVNASIQRDTRASNFNNLDYEANSAGITAQLLF